VREKRAPRVPLSPLRQPVGQLAKYAYCSSFWWSEKIGTSESADLKVTGLPFGFHEEIGVRRTRPGRAQLIEQRIVDLARGSFGGSSLKNTPVVP